MGKTDSTFGRLLCCQLKRGYDGENQRHLPTHSPFFPGSTSPLHAQLLYLCSTKQCREGEEWSLWLIRNCSSLPLLPPHAVPTALAWGFSWRLRVLQGMSTSSSVESSWDAGGCLLHCGHPWAAGGQPALPWAAEESVLWHVEHLPLPSSTDLVCRAVSPTVFSVLLTSAVFSALSSVCFPLSCWAQQSLAVG